MECHLGASTVQVCAIWRNSLILASFGEMHYQSEMNGFAEAQSGFFHADPLTPEVTAPEAAAMLRAVLNLFDRWELRPAQTRVLLGSPAERTLQRWRSGQIAGVPHDTVYRLGCLLGIHKALRYMFSAPERGYEWVKKPNEAFGGNSALDKMLQGAPTDIAEVRAFLDAERAGW
jgi:hypothetical protein